MKTDLNKLGNWLAELRVKSGYESQRQLCLASGISPATLSRIEAGIQKPEPETLKKLAPYLKEISYEELLRAAGYLETDDPIIDALGNDVELLAFFNELQKREDLQLLFKQVKPLSPETIRRIIKYIKIVEDEESLS